MARKTKKAPKSDSPEYHRKMWYIGPDDVESGLVHGKKYTVDAVPMNSGRYSVMVDSDDSSLKIRRHKYASESDFLLNFKG